MNSQFLSPQKRFASLKLRIKTLSSLRKIVALSPEHDISERQWSVLESQLVSAEARLFARLKRATRDHLSRLHQPRVVQSLNSLYGEIELEMARAFTFFDTYMDILTQRHTPELGPILAGCDVLAWDAIRKDHPALAIVEPPLVYCDRGFGASTLREGVMLPDGTPNPMPLIQIPYTRLKEKYNLTSIIHEVGHEAMVRLGLVSVIPKVFDFALSKAGAPEAIRNLFALWSSEIGPDFWNFCATGMAQSASIKEILSLPPNHVFRVLWTDSHPPPYLRVLLSFEWCRQMWGKGEWNNWEEEWQELYPLKDISEGKKRLLKKATSYLPVIARVLLTTKFKALNRRTIFNLFNLSALAPSELLRFANAVNSDKLAFKQISPCVQLAVFRLVRDNNKLKEGVIDSIMTDWLLQLKQ